LATEELRHKNETKLVKKIYLIEPKAENVDKLDITKMDIINDAFAGSWPKFSFINSPMMQFSELLDTVCEGRF